MVLAFPEEGDLGKEEKKEDAFAIREVGLLAGASGRCLIPPTSTTIMVITEGETEAQWLKDMPSSCS